MLYPSLPLRNKRSKHLVFLCIISYLFFGSMNIWAMPLTFEFIDGGNERLLSWSEDIVSIRDSHGEELPVADAFEEREAKGAHAVNLESPTSDDPYNFDLSYGWIQMAGVSAILSDAARVQAIASLQSNKDDVPIFELTKRGPSGLKSTSEFAGRLSRSLDLSPIGGTASGDVVRASIDPTEVSSFDLLLGQQALDSPGKLYLSLEVRGIPQWEGLMWFRPSDEMSPPYLQPAATPEGFLPNAEDMAFFEGLLTASPRDLGPFQVSVSQELLGLVLIFKSWYLKGGEPFNSNNLNLIQTVVVSLENEFGSVNTHKVAIPKQTDWFTRGVAISAGQPGSWDERLYGMISPCSVLKIDGTYFLYYIGADGDRSTDNGPRHRALGLATSTDGIVFQKYDGNPILEHLPNDNEEEGIFSAAAMINKEGKILLYYAALDAGNRRSISVDSDVRLAVSEDGYTFNDIGDVISHSDQEIWGYGDELFPVGAFHGDDSFFLFYIAKGHSTRWGLGIATGPNEYVIKNTSQIIDSGPYVVGGSGPIVFSPYRAVFAIRRGFDDSDNSIIELREFNPSDPTTLSEPIEAYSFSGYRHNMLHMDSENKTWFLYQQEIEGNSIIVRTAPVIGSDLQ